MASWCCQSPSKTVIVLWLISVVQFGGSCLNHIRERCAVDPPRVDDERGVLRHEGVIHVAVVGDDERRVARGQRRRSQRRALHGREARPGAHPRRRGDVGVVVRDLGAEVQEQVDDLEGGALARVVDVALVGDAEHQDPAPLHGAAAVVQSRLELPHHVVGHAQVHVAGQLDELR